MRVLAVGQAGPPLDRARAAGHEVRRLGGELPRYGDRNEPSLLRALWLERNALAALRHAIEDFEPDVVVWLDIGGLPVSLLEHVRRRGTRSIALVDGAWLEQLRHRDRWHARGRYRHPWLSVILERLASIPRTVDLDRAAHYVFFDRRLLLRARRSGLALPDAVVATTSPSEALGQALTDGVANHGARPASARMEISVVIPTIGRPDALARTLAALSTQTLSRDRFEVIVVEDANSSGLLGGAERSGLPLRQLKAEIPGASAARNLGWREARHPVILYLGDDMIADRRLLEEHLLWHEREPEDWVAVLGHVAWSHELKVTPFMRWLEKGIQFAFHTINGPEAGLGHFYTSNVSVKRAALEATGGFDEQRFPFHYEDLELGYRLAERGMRLLYNRRARVEHWHQISLEGYRSRMAGVAEAEMRWVELYPEQAPYYQGRLAKAAARPPYQARGRLLLRFVGPRTPWLGPRVWRSATGYYLQQLAPDYLSAWEEAVRRRKRSAER